MRSWVHDRDSKLLRLKLTTPFDIFIIKNNDEEIKILIVTDIKIE